MASSEVPFLLLRMLPASQVPVDEVLKTVAMAPPRGSDGWLFSACQVAPFHRKSFGVRSGPNPAADACSSARKFLAEIALIGPSPPVPGTLTIRHRVPLNRAA